MNNFVTNIFKGFLLRFKSIFHRPLSAFGISWLDEKILKHRKDKRTKKILFLKKYLTYFNDANEFLISVDELFVNEFYKFHTQELSPTIIDCGSYIGTSILYFKTIYPNAIIKGFEPDSNNFSILKKNLDSWQFNNIEIFNAAIWKENGFIEFESSGGMSGSIQNETSVQGNKSLIKVPCIRLKELLISRIDFLKIDIEGAEFEVLRDCKDHLHFVENLFVEYHGNYNNLTNLNEILNLIVECGFKYYIKEGPLMHKNPFLEPENENNFDIILNILAFRLRK